MSLRRLSLKPEVSEVARLNRWLDDAFRETGAPSAVARDLKLCLNEAVSNSILYGFDGIAEPQIDVALTLDDTRATALVVDNGTPFDPTTWPAREKPESLDQAAACGFGLQLMRETADRIEYSRVNEQNRLRIDCGG
jgi:anti-sigma regulatory factor (Ser/Thr protein kinase)